MKNIFTIDTEDWFHANYEDDLFRNDAAVKSTVEENTEVYLEALERNHATATFFVLGFVAEQHPGLVQKIAQAGHEVASHGYGHQLVYKQTPEEFRQDIQRSKKLLEDIIGKSVRGYRAPSWSITEESVSSPSKISSMESAVRPDSRLRRQSTSPGRRSCWRSRRLR